jgi:hypothetical protein
MLLNLNGKLGQRYRWPSFVLPQFSSSFRCCHFRRASFVFGFDGNLGASCVPSSGRNGSLAKAAESAGFSVLELPRVTTCQPLDWATPPERRASLMVKKLVPVSALSNNSLLGLRR